MRLALRQTGRELTHLSPEAKIRDQRMTADRLWEDLARRMEERIREDRRRAEQGDRLYDLMKNAIRDARRRLETGGRIDHRMDRILTRDRHRMEILAGSLAHLSPLARLSGGYGYLSRTDGGAVCSVRDLRENDRFRVRLRDGSIDARAEAVCPEPDFVPEPDSVPGPGEDAE